MRILNWGFALIGTLFFVIGFTTYLDARRFLNRSVEGEGIIESVERRSSDDGYMYKPTFAYTDQNGRTHRIKSNVSTGKAVYEGQAIKVFYRVDDPSRARIKGRDFMWGMAFMFMFLGGIFAAVGWGFIGHRARQDYVTNRLYQHGRRVLGRVIGVKENTSLSYNGVHPFIIEAEWRDPKTSELLLFKSQNLWFDPSDQLRDTISCLVDQDDNRRRAIDTRGLSKP